MVQFATKHMEDIKIGLKMVVDFVKDLFSPEGREKVGKQIAEGLGKLLQMVWDNFSLFGNSEDKAKRENAESDYARSNDLAGAGMDFSAGSFAEGGVASGPKSGYMANLHGTEAVVPLPDGRRLPVNLDLKMPDFSAIMSEVQSFRTEIQQKIKDKTGLPTDEDLGNMFSSFKDNLFGKDAPKTETADPSKDLITELQQLNKQTAQMLSYMRETTDFTRRNLDAIRGLNGNLLI
jgi:hypothetical protein